MINPQDALCLSQANANTTEKREFPPKEMIAAIEGSIVNACKAGKTETTITIQGGPAYNAAVLQFRKHVWNAEWYLKSIGYKVVVQTERRPDGEIKMTIDWNSK